MPVAVFFISTLALTSQLSPNLYIAPKVMYSVSELLNSRVKFLIT